MSIFDILKSLDLNKKNNNTSSHAPEFIVCGLGNPGTRYENTRHNAGFMVVDKLAQDLGVRINKMKFKSLISFASVGEKSCLLMKPGTFMNLSGQAVVEGMSFYKIPSEKVIIILDDYNGKIGSIKIKRNGSDGGQNGMKNIIYLSGSDKFPRIKIGIGEKPHPEFPLSEWVTSPFRKEEGEGLEKSISNAVDAIKIILNDKIETAMNKYNGK